MNDIFLRKDKIAKIKESCSCKLSKLQINELLSFLNINKVNYLLNLWDELNKYNDMLFIKNIKKNKIV